MDDVPIAQPYRRIPPAVLGEVKAHISDLLSRGIITPSSSPYASPIVVVRKKSGELEAMCGLQEGQQHYPEGLIPSPTD